MIIHQLSPSSLYAVRVAAVSMDGVGKYSDSLPIQTGLFGVFHNLGMALITRFEGPKHLELEELKLVDDTNNEVISGACLAVKFFLHIEWIDEPAQQRLLGQNLKTSVLFT